MTPIEKHLSKSYRFKLFHSPADETSIGRLTFAISKIALRRAYEEFKYVPLKPYKDNLDPILNQMFESTFNHVFDAFSEINETIDIETFEEGFLYGEGWNSDYKYATIFDVVLRLVEIWNRYIYNVLPGKHKDVWLSLLSEKVKWGKVRMDGDLPLIDPHCKLFAPFEDPKLFKELDTFQEVFLNHSRNRLPERVRHAKATCYYSRTSPDAYRRDVTNRSCVCRDLRSA